MRSIRIVGCMQMPDRDVDGVPIGGYCVWWTTHMVLWIWTWIWTYNVAGCYSLVSLLLLKYSE